MKRFIVPSSWSRKAIGSILVAAIACMVACGDDSSSSGPNGELVSVESSSSSKKLSSSSVIPSETKQSSSSSAKSSSSSVQKNSSSSEKAKSSSSKDEKETKASSNSVKSNSSSSVIPGNDPESSSSLTKSSSSNAKSSSSSVDAPLTSSETESSSSSSEDKVNCSVLLEGKTGWSWDVPKECRFNPDINYDTMTDERDGKVYRTVKIGDQTWMAENLNFDPGQGGSDDAKYDWSWCYNNEPKNCEVAGRLYTWAAAIDSVKFANDADIPQDCGYMMTCSLPDTVYGICPPGWHLPDTTEWNALFTAVGGRSVAGKALKSRRGWHMGWTDGGNGLDTFGFAALPVGYRRYNRDFDEDGYGAFFWSPAESDSDYAFSIGMGYGGGMARIESNPKRSGFSIRCVKNE